MFQMTCYGTKWSMDKTVWLDVQNECCSTRGCRDH